MFHNPLDFFFLGCSPRSLSSEILGARFYTHFRLKKVPPQELSVGFSNHTLQTLFVRDSLKIPVLKLLKFDFSLE